MPDREKVIKAAEDYEPYARVFTNMTVKGDLFLDMLTMLKEQEAVVNCSECENWVPGYITDRDDFIPPKCGKYQQMVGHSAGDYCSLAKKQEGL